MHRHLAHYCYFGHRRRPSLSSLPSAAVHTAARLAKAPCCRHPSLRLIPANHQPSSPGLHTHHTSHHLFTSPLPALPPPHGTLFSLRPTPCPPSVAVNPAHHTTLAEPTHQPRTSNLDATGADNCCARLSRCSSRSLPFASSHRPLDSHSHPTPSTLSHTLRPSPATARQVFPSKLPPSCPAALAASPSSTRPQQAKLRKHHPPHTCTDPLARSRSHPSFPFARSPPSAPPPRGHRVTGPAA